MHTKNKVYPLPLNVNYRSNGTGRDSYIGFSSGGQFKPYAPSGKAEGVNPE